MAGLSSRQLKYQESFALVFGAIFAAFIALLWTGLVVAGVGGSWGFVLLTALVALGILVLARGVYLWIRYPLKRVALPYLRSWRFWMKFYGAILIEFGFIYALIQLLDTKHIEEGLFPLIVFVVGAHFYPLARWNGNTLWYGTATALCVAMVVVVVAVPRDRWMLASASVMVATMLITSLVSGQRYKQVTNQGSRI
jgi:hypothetical protein